MTTEPTSSNEEDNYMQLKALENLWKKLVDLKLKFVLSNGSFQSLNRTVTLNHAKTVEPSVK